jgi:type II secretory pathway predicted ATPase ExeA
MYESFYGLNSKPFQLNPDPSFYFASKQHRRATAYLEYGMHQNEGFIIITGEVGAGKTTIVRGLLESLDQDKVVAAHRGCIWHPDQRRFKRGRADVA